MPYTNEELRQKLDAVENGLLALFDLEAKHGATAATRAAAAEMYRDRDKLLRQSPVVPPAVTTRQAIPGPAGAGPAGAFRTTDDQPAAFGLERRDGMTDWARDHHPQRFDGPQLSLSRYLRGALTGNWDNARDELRAYSEGGATAGQTLVPTPLASNVIDLARNQMRVMQAGALTVPMDSQTLKIAKITGDPTASWRNEGAAISEGTGTLGSVTFTAQSLAFYVKVSRELVEDATPGDGVDQVLRRQIAQVIALELDRVALRGSGSAPEPRGVLNQSGVTLTDHGANGSAITNYDFWLDAIGTVRSSNFEPTAHIQAPRSSTSLSKLKEATTNAYLRRPEGLLPMLATKQIPINLTVGTSTDCSEVYTGQWDQLLIGLRTELQIEVLREAGMIANGQYYFLAWMRADVQLAQAAAFNVDRGVRA